LAKQKAECVYKLNVYTKFFVMMWQNGNVK